MKRGVTVSDEWVLANAPKLTLNQAKTRMGCNESTLRRAAKRLGVEWVAEKRRAEKC